MGPEHLRLSRGRERGLSCCFCTTLCLGARVPFRDGRREQKELIQHGLSVGNLHLFDMRVLYFMLPVTSLAELCAAFSHRLSIMTGNPILKVTD